MRDSIEQLQLQWRQNSRLRLGGLLVCAILSGYVLLLAGDYRDQLLEDYAQQQLRLRKLQNISKQAEWPQRAEQAQARLLRVEGLLWQAESKGLAQATLQSWFNRNLPKIGLRDLKVDTELAHEIPGGKGMWQATANLDGVLDRGQVVKLLGLLELHDKLITIEQLKITRTRKGFRMQLQLRAWFQGAASALGVEVS